MKPALKPAGASAFTDLVSAAHTLANDEAWRELLAENLYWASMEAFLQSSLLGALNRTSPSFVADRERSLGKDTVRPDLLVFPRASHDDWWVGRELGGARASAVYRSQATLFVQLKVAWTEGNAYASARLRYKCQSVAWDIDLLRAHAPETPGAIGVLVSGFHPSGEGAAEVNDSIGQIRRRIAADVAKEEAVPLLDGFLPQRWSDLQATPKAAFSTLWLAQLTPAPTLKGKR